MSLKLTAMSNSYIYLAVPKSLCMYLSSDVEALLNKPKVKWFLHSDLQVFFSHHVKCAINYYVPQIQLSVSILLGAARL